MRGVLLGTVIALLLPAAVHAARCPTDLGNNVLRCAVRGEDGSQFEDCFRFATPGAVSGKFEFVSDLLGSAVGCTCKPAGKKFTSSSFECVSIKGVSFEGRLKRKGAVSKGTIANVNGGAYVFDLVANHHPARYAAGVAQIDTLVLALAGPGTPVRGVASSDRCETPAAGR